jgi:hypothetical protein
MNELNLKALISKMKTLAFQGMYYARCNLMVNIKIAEQDCNVDYLG